MGTGTGYHRASIEIHTVDVSVYDLHVQEPHILERTVKCCLLNGAVFWTSILIFENVVLPTLQMVVFFCMAGRNQFKNIYMLLREKKYVFDITDFLFVY
jgi:hypothetical protein